MSNHCAVLTGFYGKLNQDFKEKPTMLHYEKHKDWGGYLGICMRNKDQEKWAAMTKTKIKNGRS